MQPIIDFISNFTTPNEEELQAIFGMLHFSSHKKNEILHQQMTIPKRMAFIIKGGLRVYYSDENGKTHTVGFVFENNHSIDFECFSRQIPSSLEAATLEPTDLVSVSYADFFNFIETYPKYEIILRKVLSENSQFEMEKAKLLRIGSARERYEAFCKLRPTIINRVPLKYVASYLDMALETLSRIRAEK